MPRRPQVCLPIRFFSPSLRWGRSVIPSCGRPAPTPRKPFYKQLKLVLDYRIAREQARNPVSLFVRRTLKRFPKRDRSDDTRDHSPVSGPGHTLPQAASSRDWETTGLAVWSGGGCPGLGVTPPPPFYFPTAKYIVQVDGKIGLFRGLSPRLMSNALSTVTRGSMKKVSRYPGFPRLWSLPGRPWSHVLYRPQDTAPGFVLGRPPAFPLCVPNLVLNDGPDNGPSAQRPLGVHASLTACLWLGLPSRRDRAGFQQG